MNAEPQRLPVGPLLAIAGALLLFVSLFIDWYRPDINAWKVFEIVDLLLAGAALGVVAAALARLGTGLAWGDARQLLLPLAILALVLVIVQVVNHPPAAIGREKEVGIFLALGGAALMTAGAVVTVARISVALNVSDAEDEDGGTGRRAGEPGARPGLFSDPAGGATDPRGASEGPPAGEAAPASGDPGPPPASDDPTQPLRRPEEG